MALSRDDKLAVYETLVAETPDLKVKGKKTAYTSMNGNMFSFLSPEGDLAFRFQKADREAFLERFPEAVVVQYDTVMKDYVGLPDPLIEDRDELRRLFASSVEQARALKPKATTRPKKTTGAKQKTRKQSP